MTGTRSCGKVRCTVLDFVHGGFGVVEVRFFPVYGCAAFVAAMAGFCSPAFGVEFGRYGADGHYYQALIVAAEAGAQCTMTRSGERIAHFSIPDERSGLASAHVVYVDVTASKEDIEVVCAGREGDQEAQVRWGKSDFFADGSLCAESQRVLKPCEAIHGYHEQYVPANVRVSSIAQK